MPTPNAKQASPSSTIQLTTQSTPTLPTAWFPASQTTTHSIFTFTGFPSTTTTTSTRYPSTYPIVSRFPVRVTQSGVVYISTATITLNPVTNRPTSSAVSHSKEDGSNKGAIAGGVIGALAVVIAVILTFLWFRRRSPAHWRNKANTRGWRNLGGALVGGGGKEAPILPATTNDVIKEGKSAVPDFTQHTPAAAEDPFKDPVESPPPALYIREHRQPVQNPFADPQLPESPTSPRPTHKRGTSSVNPLLGPKA